jgi:hypothetical protein
MSVLTQGTQVFAFDPADGTVITIQCATTFSPGGAPADQIEDTCLEETDSRSYKSGLRTPGQATLGVNADPSKQSHITLYEFSQQNPSPVLKWAVGWSDGTDAPTVNTEGDDWELPAGRTWYTFNGYVSDFPFSFEQNSIVASEVTIQRSGSSGWTRKTANTGG